MGKVNTQHPEYKAMVKKWQRCRDCVAGQDAVKEAGETYLPRLTDQETADYNAYKLRAQFFNATWRTISALAGMMFRRAPVVEVATNVETMLKDVTMSGQSFYTFAKRVALEILTVGRVGILVDYPSQSVEGMTLADAQKLNLRPTMQMYPTESIINWKRKWIANESKLSLVVLSELEEISDDEFESETEQRYRVLDLVDGKYRDLVDGKYRVRRYSVDKNTKTETQISEDLYPLMNNQPLDSIPFFFLGVDDITSEMDEPPLIDLVDLNLAHYRTTADYNNGLHLTGLPTPVVTGYQKDENEKLYIGRPYAWVFPDPNASATFLEFTGQGLTALENALTRLEQQMAIVGARLLTAEKKDAETAQTAQIHRAGESSTLSGISLTLSDGMTKALTVFSKWAGSDKEATVTTNTEFMPPAMAPEELTALLSGWQMGAPGLSDQGLFDILQQREVIRPDVTLEEEQERIASKPLPRPEMGDEGDDE